MAQFLENRKPPKLTQDKNREGISPNSLNGAMIITILKPKTLQEEKTTDQYPSGTQKNIQENI